MRREQTYCDFPPEWAKRKAAGLCPACGKTKEEFEKNRKVYCSTECADKWADYYHTWSELRDRMIEKNPKCQKCSATEKKWEAEVEKGRKEFYADEKNKEKIRNIINAEKAKKLAYLEAHFLHDIKRVESLDVKNWQVQRALDRKGLEYDEPRQPTFELDHIKALKDGGDMWDESNLQILCYKCHKKKHRSKKKLKKRVEAL